MNKFIWRKPVGFYVFSANKDDPVAYYSVGPANSFYRKDLISHKQICVRPINSPMFKFFVEKQG